MSLELDSETGMSGSEVDELLVGEGEVVDAVPQRHQRAAHRRPRARVEVAAPREVAQAVVEVEQLVLQRGRGVTEQVLHGQAPIGLSRRSTVRLAFSSKRGSSPAAAPPTSKRSPPWAAARSLARRPARSSKAPSGASGLSSTRRVTRSNRLSASRANTSWNSSTSGYSRTIASTAR